MVWLIVGIVVVCILALCGLRSGAGEILDSVIEQERGRVVKARNLLRAVPGDITPLGPQYLAKATPILAEGLVDVAKAEEALADKSLSQHERYDEVHHRCEMATWRAGHAMTVCTAAYAAALKNGIDDTLAHESFEKGKPVTISMPIEGIGGFPERTAAAVKAALAGLFEDEGWDADWVMQGNHSALVLKKRETGFGVWLKQTFLTGVPVRASH